MSDKEREKTSDKNFIKKLWAEKDEFLGKEVEVENVSNSFEEDSMSKKFKKIQIVAIVSFVLAIIAIFVTLDGKISVDSIIENANKSPMHSIFFLILLFAIKSLSVVIPLASLYVASGILFTPFKSVLVSYLGLFVTLSLPYILGRWSGAEGIEYIKKKFPKINRVIEMQKNNQFFACFIVRIVGWFPCDVASFYFGACKTDYSIYIVASLIGCAIGLLTNTLMGEVILNPLSLQFAAFILIKILISLSAIVIAYYLKKGKKI